MAKFKLNKAFSLSAISTALGATLLIREHPDAWQLPSNALGIFHLGLAALYLRAGISKAVSSEKAHERRDLSGARSPTNFTTLKGPPGPP